MQARRTGGVCFCVWGGGGSPKLIGYASLGLDKAHGCGTILSDCLSIIYGPQCCTTRAYSAGRHTHNLNLFRNRDRYIRSVLQGSSCRDECNHALFPPRREKHSTIVSYTMHNSLYTYYSSNITIRPGYVEC